MDNFQNKTLGHRLFLSTYQYLEDLGGTSIPGWYDMNPEARAAWEAEGIRIVISDASDEAFVDAIYRASVTND